MPKIVFVYPEFENLGIATLMAVCRREGFEPVLQLYRADNAYVGAGASTPPYARIAEKLLAHDPLLVAFSAVTDNYRHQLAVARELKRLAPKVFTLFGGIHATSVPGRVLSEEAVDAVAVGEAEASFAAFLRQGLRDGDFTPPSPPPRGIYLRAAPPPAAWEEGELPDLDTLPFPEKDAFYAQLPFARRDYLVITSRGCPYGCSYCCNAVYRALRGAARVRRRSADNVLEELRRAVKRHRPRYVTFVDDSFTTDPRWLDDFLPRYRAEIGLPFLCNAIPALLTPDLVRRLRLAGCVDVQMGAQTLDEALCAEVLRRRPDLPALREAVGAAKKEGLLTQVDHMFGIPGDTPEREEKAAAFYNEIRPHIVSVFWLTYYPGTPIVETALAQGLLDEADVERLEAGLPLTSGTLHGGGSLKDPEPYWGIHLLLNWLPLLPPALVSWALARRLHRRLPARGYLLSTALPRVVRSLLDRRYYVGRGHLLHLLGRLRPPR